MLNKFPKNVSTMIEAEEVAEMYPITINEIVEHLFNDKKYVLYLGIFILDCLVFNLQGDLIDSYSFEDSGEKYKGKLFMDWMKDSKIYEGESK